MQLPFGGLVLSVYKHIATTNSVELVQGGVGSAVALSSGYSGVALIH